MTPTPPAPKTTTSRESPLTAASRYQQLRSHQAELAQTGHDLQLVLGGMRQWGDDHLPWAQGPSIQRHSPAGELVRLRYLDESGREIPPAEVDLLMVVTTIGQGGIGQVCASMVPQIRVPSDSSTGTLGAAAIVLPDAPLCRHYLVCSR